MERTIYTPLTATPLNKNRAYREVLPQSPELAGYIRCFWGSEGPYSPQEIHDGVTIITPDTCVDIIYQIDHTENTITSVFCGINDASFFAYNDAGDGIDSNADGNTNSDTDDSNTMKKEHFISTFAIRFYGWSAYAFSEDSLKDTLNGFHETEARFRWLDRILRPQLFEKSTLTQRAEEAEKLLLRRLSNRGRQNRVVEQAVQEILSRKGTLSAAELAGVCCISGRQLERLFYEYIGITPKKLGNLVRYQFLWNDIFRNPNFHVLDGVYKYGYTDQSHLLREFKRYHTMDVQTARQYAYHVGNIQYMSGGQ